ncbi:hypothetical protein V8G54_025884 [Vigna mungo]|uniref:Uncharacterized protein n=1 Tax=Vigna mungo TaxID=3915 RepID=A0AAQ3MZJ3_VIGMU
MHENLAHTVLQQRRSHLGLQVFYQALQVNPGIAKVCVKHVLDDTKARPASFSHDEGDGLVAGDNEGVDNGIDHDVEEVAVADAGGEVVAEVEMVFLEERDAEGDLGVHRVEVVRQRLIKKQEYVSCKNYRSKPKSVIPGGS